MGFSRRESWSGLTFSPPENLPNPHLLCLLNWQAGCLPLASFTYIWKKKWQTMENPMDRGSWQAAVHIVEKSHTELSHFLLFNHSIRYNSLWPHRLQHARLPCPSTTPGGYSNSCPPSWWCHPVISSSVIPFSSCLQSAPASRSFLINQLFALGGQGIGASAWILPMTIQGWFPLGLTG